MTINRRHPNSSRGFVLICVGFISVIGLAQVITSRRAAPDTRQQIAATLVRWGLSLDGLALPVQSAEVDRRIADLRSPNGEVRVQAAAWLASHGVRDSAGNIAAAMDDPVTRRPCQLAKSLGELGDEYWTDTLITATQQEANTDLRVCATLALGDLQSPQAVEALIQAYRSGGMGTTALNSLGRLADPTTLTFFKQVAAQSPRATERNIARTAIERIAILQQPDPVASLMQRLDDQVSHDQIEQWTVRRLAAFRDARSVPALQRAMERLEKHDPQVWLAAALLAQGHVGRAALTHLTESARPEKNKVSATVVAEAALGLTTPDQAIAGLNSAPTAARLESTP